MKKYTQNNIKHIVLIMLILWAIFAIPVICNAAEPIDTIAFKGNIEKVITDIHTTAKGTKTTKYYFISNGYLIPTTKTVIEKYVLCKKYGAKCALDAIVSKKTKKIKKIILG